MFKVGDKVVCIDDRDGYGHILKGFTYVVDKCIVHCGEISVSGQRASWRANRFELVKEPVVRNKYQREIKPGVWVDVYDVLRAFTVTDPSLQHLLKKALAVGQRGHKDETEDYEDILASAKRAVEMHAESSKFESVVK